MQRIVKRDAEAHQCGCAYHHAEVVFLASHSNTHREVRLKESIAASVVRPTGLRRSQARCTA